VDNNAENNNNAPFPVRVDRNGDFMGEPVAGFASIEEMEAAGWEVGSRDYGTDREGWRIWMKPPR
jgi:hypothetical protein